MLSTWIAMGGKPFAAWQQTPPYNETATNINEMALMLKSCRAASGKSDMAELQS